jgi:protein-disulfide isomerase
VTFCGLDDGFGGSEERGAALRDTACDAISYSGSNSIVSRCAFDCGTGYAVRGPAKAPVTIVAWSDFECPFCQRAEPTVRQVMSDYNGKVKLVYMQFPLSFHPNAQKAAEASECANDQGKFWEYNDRLYDTTQLGVPSLKQHAASLGLDTAKFNQCLDSGANAGKVAAMQAMGSQNGVSGTPTFFINGQPLVGAQPYANFKAAIDQQLAASG